MGFRESWWWWRKSKSKWRCKWDCKWMWQRLDTRHLHLLYRSTSTSTSSTIPLPLPLRQPQRQWQQLWQGAGTRIAFNEFWDCGPAYVSLLRAGPSDRAAIYVWGRSVTSEPKTWASQLRLGSQLSQFSVPSSQLPSLRLTQLNWNHRPMLLRWCRHLATFLWPENNCAHPFPFSAWTDADADGFCLG